MIDFSVVIKVDADSAYLNRCLRSVVSQSVFGRRFEIILVGPDDYSSYVSAFEKQISIRALSFENTIKFVEVLRVCGGRFISLMHSNDYLSDHLYFTQLLVLNDNNDIQGVYCKYMLVDLNENKLQKVLPSDEFNLFGIMLRVEAAYKLLKNENASSIDSFDSLLESFRRNLSLILLPISFYRKLVN